LNEFSQENPIDKSMSTPSSIFNLKIDPITSDELLARAQKSLQDAAGECILLINAHFANLAYERPWLRHYANRKGASFGFDRSVTLRVALTRVFIIFVAGLY